MLEQHPPPAPQGRRIKMRYMTQVNTRPPGFVVMCSHPELVPESYTRYLVNGLRVDFDMPGTPIRLHLRGQGAANPYKGRTNRVQASRLRKHTDGRRPVRQGRLAGQGAAQIARLRRNLAGLRCQSATETRAGASFMPIKTPSRSPNTARSPSTES